MSEPYGPSKMLGLFKQSMVAARLLSDAPREWYGLTDREMALRRMHWEFELKLLHTEYGQQWVAAAVDRDCRRFRVVCVYVPREEFAANDPSMPLEVWVSVLVGPMTFQEAQFQVNNYYDCHRRRLARGENVFLIRAFMQEIA